jgi:hypothetical protein
LQTEATLVKAIREARRVPVQRNSFYEPIKVHEESGGEAQENGDGRSKILDGNLATA